MANSFNSSDNQDIDLKQLSQKTKAYFSRVNDSFFDGILFIKRNIIIIILLVIIGAGIGYYKDSKSAIYEQKIFVIPNFGSTDYLYEEVGAISSKLSLHDEDFFKRSGLEHPEKIAKIEIEPIVEIYDFIEDKDVDEDDRKFQLFRLISENGDMKKMLEDKVTSRYYKHHVITITTRGEVNRADVVDPILRYFNGNDYYLKMKKDYTNNLDLKIAANDSIIKQIDAILNDYSRKGNAGLVYYSDNTDMSEVIKYKNKLVKEQGQNRIDKANSDQILTEGGVIMNVFATTITIGRMKIIIPFLFVLAFVIGVKFRDYYKKQMAKRVVAA